MFLCSLFICINYSCLALSGSDFPSLTIYLIKLIYCFYGGFTQLSLQSSRLLGENISLSTFQMLLDTTYAYAVHSIYQAKLRENLLLDVPQSYYCFYIVLN